MNTYAKYPRIGVYPEHCGIYKKGCDGPYVVRRKVVSLDGKNGTAFVDGQTIQVQRTHALEADKAVLWETYQQKEVRP